MIKINQLFNILNILHKNNTKLRSIIDTKTAFQDNHIHTKGERHAYANAGGSNF